MLEKKNSAFSCIKRLNVSHAIPVIIKIIILIKNSSNNNKNSKNSNGNNNNNNKFWLKQW